MRVRVWGAALWCGLTHSGGQVKAGAGRVATSRGYLVIKWRWWARFSCGSKTKPMKAAGALRFLD